MAESSLKFAALTEATINASPQFFYNDLTQTLSPMCLTWTPYMIFTRWNVGTETHEVDVTEAVLEGMGSKWNGFIPSKAKHLYDVAPRMNMPRRVQTLLYKYMDLEDWGVYETWATVPFEWISHLDVEEWWAKGMGEAARDYYSLMPGRPCPAKREKMAIRWACCQWDLDNLEEADYNGD